MRLTIGKKLTLGFLFLAFLVLLSGGVGILILNTVSRSADTVAKDKAPTQYAVMKASLAIETIDKGLTRYVLSSSGLAEQEKWLLDKLDEFNMWIAMMDFGTDSDKFRSNPAFKTYKRLKLNIQLPMVSDELMATLDKIIEESSVFKESSVALMQAHNEYLAYSVIDGEKIYDLPTYLLFLQREQTRWMKALKDAVTGVLPFKGNLDPEKGMLGIWLHTYETKDEALVKLIKKAGKYNTKLMKAAVTINGQDESKGKNKYLSRSMGPSIRIQQTLEKVHSHVTPIYKALDNTKTEKFNALDQSSVKINKSLDRLILGAEKEMATALENSESSKKNGVVFLVSLTVGAVVLAIVLGLYLSRYMTRSITALADVTQDVSNGNLQKTVDITSKDELGDLANSTNAMTENLRQIIQKISTYSQDLTTASVDLTSLSSSMSASAENMTLKSESVAAAAEEMSSNMNTVATGAGEATNNINTVSISTEEINSSISEIAKNSETGSAVAQEAVAKAQSATERMNELGTAAQGISKVTEVISEISEQTNLLALNATIEAARAGEAGKGFAVVATEIKQLALQTADATNDIKTRIQGIQDATSDTVTEIEGVSAIIGSINEVVSTIAAAVEEQSATTKEIADNMGHASAGLQDVSDNVAESTNVSNEIAKDIGDVFTSSNEVLTESGHVSTSSENLKKLADGLQELISHFKI